MDFKTYSLRRRFPRVESERPILVRRERDRAPGRVFTTRVVGLGGCMFVHDRPLGVGVGLQLSLLIGLKLANVAARVVYQNPQRDSTYQIGVEFIDPSPKDLDILQSLVRTSAH